MSSSHPGGDARQYSETCCGSSWGECGGVADDSSFVGGISSGFRAGLAGCRVCGMVLTRRLTLGYFRVVHAGRIEGPEGWQSVFLATILAGRYGDRAGSARHPVAVLCGWCSWSSGFRMRVGWHLWPPIHGAENAPWMGHPREFVASAAVLLLRCGFPQMAGISTGVLRACENGLAARILITYG